MKLEEYKVDLETQTFTYNELNNEKYKLDVAIKIDKEAILREAKNGALVKTKDGNNVRIISFDGKSNKNQIAAWVTDTNGEEILRSYNNNGYYQRTEDDSRNLVIIEERNVTKEEEGLIYEDICHRLSNGVYVNELITNENSELIGDDKVIYTLDYHPNIKNCIPYLYPYNFKEPEFVNETDKKDYLKFWDFYDERGDANKINWLYKHNYDVNGLIPKGLAKNLSEYETKNNKKKFKFF